MFQYFKKLQYLFTFTFLLFILFVPTMNVYAKDFSNYSYDKVFKSLPKKYQNKEYVYDQNNDGFIRFADYDGVAYCMSIKHSSDDNNFIYCVDYSKKITMNTSYKKNNSLFEPELRTRIGIALKYGTTNWDGLADASYTTGNSITDYYMTQIVIHSLIYHFSDKHSNYGIDHTKLSYYDNTSTLKKKTKALYNLCSKATINFTNGELENTQFSFSSGSNNLCLENNALVSEVIKCNVASDNAQVASYDINLHDSDNLNAVFKDIGSTYDSSFQIEIPFQTAEELDPGLYHVSVDETVQFKPYVASFWNCNDKAIKNENQEVAELSLESKSASDSITFDFIIGEVTLKKTDSISGVIIPDAQFEIHQYNDSSKKYEYYKSMSYDKATNTYISGNLYPNATNSKAMFKVIEAKPGKYYKNDWKGQEFQLTEKTNVYHFNVENQPILGSLVINKVGDNPTFKECKLSYKPYNKMKDVSFSLYAANDIYLKDKCVYKLNQKILDLTTDEKGVAKADELPAGDYYLKETNTNEYHIIDEKDYHFTIKQDNDRKYTQYVLNLENKLKSCSIKLYKYTQSKDKEATKTPLKNAKFGLYSANDLIDLNNNCIAHKDDLIEEGCTNSKGCLQFNNLLYADYYIKELEAPEGYLINDSIIPISKNEFQIDKESNYFVEKECLNQPKQFQIHIQKNGEVLTSVKNIDSTWGNYFIYSTTQSKLKGVTFALYQKENKQFIEEAVTNDDGIAMFHNLKAGEYYILEKAAPPQYIINSNPLDITITNDDYSTLLAKQQEEKLNIEVNDKTYGFSFQPIIKNNIDNTLFKTKISIRKTGENATYTKKGITYDSKPLNQVVFGLYQNFDYQCKDQIMTKKNTCVGYIVTTQDGVGTLEAKLPIGDYYLKEIKTNPGYDLDQTQYPIHIENKPNQDLNLDLTQTLSLHNLLSKSSVNIHKTNINTKKPLKNVEFTLYTENGDFIGTYKTNKKGDINVDQLPYGKYYFIETKTPNGYYTSNAKYNFTLDSDKPVTLNITNQPILKLGFQEPYKLLLLGILIFTLSLLFVFYSKDLKHHEV